MAVVENVDDGIWVARVALDDFEVRGALILGEQRAVVWDTLARPRDMRPFLPFIGTRELVIVYSHADWDHIWGTAGLPYDGVTIAAHDRCGHRFGDDVPIVLAKKQQEQPGKWDDVVLVPPTDGFEREWAIDLGGLTLNLHHLPGHTADCIVGFIPERRLLLAGDTVETPCPVVPADSPLTGWIAELRRWAEDERIDVVVPAHGPLGGRELLTRNIEYLEAIRAGHPIEPPGPTTPFYRDTHLKNLRWRAEE